MMYSDRKEIRFSVKQVACAVCLVLTILLSNVYVNALASLILFMLFRQKRLDISLPNLVIMSELFSANLIFLLLEKMKILFWQGFFPEYLSINAIAKNFTSDINCLAVLLSIYLGLISLRKKKVWPLLFLLYVFFSRLHFLPIIGLFFVLKINLLTVCVGTLWMIENYIVSTYAHQFPAYVQWIDLVLFVLVFPIVLVVLDIPQKIRDIRSSR